MVSILEVERRTWVTGLKVAFEVARWRSVELGKILVGVKREGGLWILALEMFVTFELKMVDVACFFLL